MEQHAASASSPTTHVIQRTRGVIVQQQTHVNNNVNNNNNNSSSTLRQNLQKSTSPVNTSPVSVRPAQQQSPHTSVLVRQQVSNVISRQTSSPQPTDRIFKDTSSGSPHSAPRSPSFTQHAYTLMQKYGITAQNAPFDVNRLQRPILPRPQSMRPSSSLRPPPSYVAPANVRQQGSLTSSVSPGGRSLIRTPASNYFRPLRFAPPMRAPLPPPRGAVNDTPRQRDFRDFNLNSGNVGLESARNQAHVNPDTLAKISELADITRASIPMPPLEDDGEIVALSSQRNSARKVVDSRPQRDLMPPPSTSGISNFSSFFLKKTFARFFR